MKILKKIVIGIGILALLLCGLIVLCAINPDIEKKLASLVPQKEETAEEKPGASGETYEIIGP